MASRPIAAFLFGIGVLLAIINPHGLAFISPFGAEGTRSGGETVSIPLLCIGVQSSVIGVSEGRRSLFGSASSADQ